MWGSGEVASCEERGAKGRGGLFQKSKGLRMGYGRLLAGLGHGQG